MYLVEKEVKEVELFLSDLGKLKREQYEEVLDHLCCDIEQTMEQGLGFTEAFARCRERWNESEVQKIHSSTQSTSIMVKLLTVIILSVGSFAFLSLPLDETAHLSVEACELAEEVIPRIDPPSSLPLAANHKLTAPYGEMIHPIEKRKRLHRGIDWGAPLGTPVQAAGAGVVLEAGDKGKYGNCVIIVHDEIYQTLYAHLQSIDVVAGQEVTAGQLIGKVGNTGVSTAPHLHYEVRKNGEPVDPANYLP